MLGAIAILALCGASPAVAGGVDLRGPVEAEMLRVIDGDTIEVRALIWPGQSLRVHVRIRGIDAPELRSRCRHEREAAVRARDVLASRLASGRVELSNIGGDKYYGRVLADVSAANTADVGASLLEAKVVRPYEGGRRPPYCG